MTIREGDVCLHNNLDNLKITWINVDDVSCDDNGNGMVVFADFDNGAGIRFTLDEVTDDPLITAVKLGLGGNCEAEGNSIVWHNGASITIQEMMAIVTTRKQGGIEA